MQMNRSVSSCRTVRALVLARVRDFSSATAPCPPVASREIDAFPIRPRKHQPRPGDQLNQRELNFRNSKPRKPLTARALIQTIKTSLERDGDCYDVGLADPLLLIEFSGKAEVLLLERNERLSTGSKSLLGNSLTRDLELVEGFYWLCKCLIGNSLQIEESLTTAYCDLLLEVSRKMSGQTGQHGSFGATAVSSSLSNSSSLASDYTKIIPKMLRIFNILHNRKSLEMANKNQLYIESVASEVFANMETILLQAHGARRNSVLERLTIGEFGVLLSAFAHRMNNGGSASGVGKQLFQEVADVLVRRSETKKLESAQPIRHDFLINAPFVLLAYAQSGHHNLNLFRHFLTHFCTYHRQIEFKSLTVVAYAMRIWKKPDQMSDPEQYAQYLDGAAKVEKEMWELLTELIKEKGQTEGDFPVRSLGMVAAALSGTNRQGSKFAVGSGFYFCKDAAEMERTMQCVEHSPQDRILDELRENLNETFFLRMKELSYHEVTHLAEVVTPSGYSQDRRDIVCLKLVEKLFLFPPTYLVSCFNSVCRWKLSGNPSRFQIKVITLLSEQLALKTRYLTADDVGLILRSLETLIKGPGEELGRSLYPSLHLSLQRELMRRLPEFSNVELETFDSTLRRLSCGGFPLQEWFDVRRGRKTALFNV